ncbi:MAG: hypothetical protein K0S41_2475 [Anaerocolumna sp.]|jgi:hypothetical protein|nr:hypothetical protein [Anaerocolumna sp.]
MSYINGKEVLPENLVSEIQKYVGGGLIYIPSPVQKLYNRLGDVIYEKKEKHHNSGCYSLCHDNSHCNTQPIYG